MKAVELVALCILASPLLKIAASLANLLLDAALELE